jgi:predicted Zn-dependent protease
MKNALRTTLTLGAFLVTAACAEASAPEYQFGKLNFSKIAEVVKDTSKAATAISEPDEIAIGQGIMSNLLGMAALLPDQEVQRYVNSVGKWVSMHSERPDLPWTFAVLDDLDPNAFAAPGGYIAITKGLLLKMKNEAELAGVLGHEIGHVVKKHHLKAVQEENARNAAKGVGSLIMESKGTDSRTRLAVDLIATIGIQLYAKGLSKDDEYESDRVGVVLATRAGYDPYGLPAVLQALQTVDPVDAGIQLMLGTHPRLSDRLDLLEKIMGAGFERYDTQPNVQGRFENMMARLKTPKK